MYPTYKRLRPSLGNQTKQPYTWPLQENKCTKNQLTPLEWKLYLFKGIWPTYNQNPVAKQENSTTMKRTHPQKETLRYKWSTMKKYVCSLLFDQLGWIFSQPNPIPNSSRVFHPKIQSHKSSLNFVFRKQQMYNERGHPISCFNSPFTLIWPFYPFNKVKWLYNLKFT